ncbi:CU044_5270 family protein [Spirillospora sp. NBC_01491]|uniref:CU044_5270 family protein n=1 Tax=Spirillospora sp. NBC_01491 TaxID=2976007 RepID=UPI002E2FDBE4|nr:CU044_5270 family protein [Spirillospora sp. NBC_01491]
MNDLEILHDTWAEPAAPSGTARASARAALLERAALSGAPAEGGKARPARRFRLRRPAVRLAAVGVLAAAVAVGVTVVQTGGTDGHGRPRPVLPGIPAGPVANASVALERAALAAEQRPFTPPRPDQWVYLESRVREGSTPNGAVSKDASKSVVTRTWKRADGKLAAHLEHGKVVTIGTGPQTTPPSDYASLVALPTDPGALLRRLYTDMGGLGSTAEGRYATAYAMLSAVLRETPLPPKTEAAVFRAIKVIPGVTLAAGRADAAGRPAIGLGRSQEGWLHKELLINPKTYEYLGERAVVVKDHESRGNDGEVALKKGDLLNLTVRLKAGIVDSPGQKP